MKKSCNGYVLGGIYHCSKSVENFSTVKRVNRSKKSDDVELLSASLENRGGLNMNLSTDVPKKIVKRIRRSKDKLNIKQKISNFNKLLKKNSPEELETSSENRRGSEDDVPKKQKVKRVRRSNIESNIKQKISNFNKLLKKNSPEELETSSENRRGSDMNPTSEEEVRRVRRNMEQSDTDSSSTGEVKKLTALFGEREHFTSFDTDREDITVDCNIVQEVCMSYCESGGSAEKVYDCFERCENIKSYCSDRFNSSSSSQ